MRGAVELFLHEVANTHTRELQTWLGTRDDRPEAWARATDMSDATLRLTPDLARELIGRMHELIDGYRALVPDGNTPDAEQVRVHTRLFPIATD